VGDDVGGQGSEYGEQGEEGVGRRRRKGWVKRKKIKCLHYSCSKAQKRMEEESWKQQPIESTVVEWSHKPLARKVGVVV
jgi:hypothetical protein